MKHLKVALFAITLSSFIAGCSSSGDKDTATYHSTGTAGAADQSLPADASTAPVQQQQVAEIYSGDKKSGQETTTTTTTTTTQEAPADTGNYKTIDYTVTEGDSLWKIARKNNTNVTRIKEANGFTSDNIRPGQTIKVPVPQ
ncbi:MAG: LysM peptidoglycan-binding domain-containing protein [Verrucomicrobiota bacterium]|nr:LysM peptidoglycan-binding domain-containing protein [Verrucomicrobiota bacterium]